MFCSPLLQPANATQMEAEEAKREAEEKAYEEERKKKQEADKLQAAERQAAEDARLRKLEREAEEAELARENQTPEQKAEIEAQNKAMFASLAKNTTLGPQASEEIPAEPAAPTPTSAKPAVAKSKPSALKLDTQKPVEPAQPTAGMQSLKSARFLQVRSELVAYPPNILSPNPAVNAQGSKAKGRQYDKDFLLQFQGVFKEKPSTDWDLKLKETVGDGTDSARPQSARGPSTMGSRQPSSRGPMGVMGNFTGATQRTLPPGTTSQQRFEQATGAGGRSMTNPLAAVVGGMSAGRSNFPMGAPIPRQGSNFANPNSPRNASARGKGGNNSRRGGGPHKNDHQEAKAMPLTAGQAVKDLDRSQTGWKVRRSMNELMRQTLTFLAYVAYYNPASATTGWPYASRHGSA